MAVPYYGDFAEDDTVIIPFNTFTSDDPSASCTITELADTDVWIYKDGNVAQHAADATVDLALNFDDITGSHLCVIDTSQDVFFTTGSEYQVRIVGTVIDAGTIEAFIGAFSIERAGGTLATVKLILADTTVIGVLGAGLTAITDDTSQIGIAGIGLTEAGGTGDQLIGIDLPNQTMDIIGDITGNLSGTVGSVTGNVDGSVATCASATVEAIVANAITDTSINADAITAAKVAADVHAESATAVWTKTEATTGQTYSYGQMAVRNYRFWNNELNITDATGAVVVRNEADDGNIATQSITDDDTTTIKTALTWT